jgi:hypothetical protein
MEALFLFTLVAVLIGAGFGWFHRRTLWGLLIRTALGTLIMMALAVLVLDGPPEHYSPKYLLHSLAYFVIPYALFVLLPGIAAAGVAFLIRRRLHREGAAKTPLSRQKL